MLQELEQIQVRVGNRISVGEMFIFIYGRVPTEKELTSMRHLLRSRGTFPFPFPVPEIANEGPVTANLLRRDRVGAGVIEIWSVGGQPFSNWADVRDLRWSKGEAIGEINVGGKVVPIYEATKRLI